TPGATDLLVIRLDGAGGREVDHGAHVGAVHAHAEGVGGDHDLQLPLHEGDLYALAFFRRKARVIGVREPAVRLEPLGFGFTALAGRPVDDGRALALARAARGGRAAPGGGRAGPAQHLVQEPVGLLAALAGAL